MASQTDVGTIVIFRRFVRLRNGRILDAYHYGKKAFPIKVRVRRTKR